jgi:hypothetical protein
MTHSQSPRLFGAVAVLSLTATAFLIPALARGADEKKERPKQKPISLAVAKVGPKVAAAATSTNPITFPDFNFDPDVPEHLRPVRLFSKDGRFFDARVLSATHEQVTVQRLNDSRTFDVAMAALDDASVRHVEAWMDRGQVEVNYSIDFEVKKRLIESDSFDSVGRNFKKLKWGYDVVLTNQSRSELKDAELEYQIVYDDEVEFVRTSAYPGNGKNQREERSVSLPTLSFNGRAEFTTPAVEMQTYEYAPLRGDREYRRDEIVGIWIRILKNGEVVSEFQSHPAAMQSLTWDGEEEIEIVVKDSFQDQFTSEGKTTE